MIRVAMLSFWHVHARDYARQATEHPGTEIVAVWDEIPERGRQEAEARGARFFEDLNELLAQSDIDGVIVDTPTNMHRDVMVAAAKAGKHIFTEKVVATTLKECNEILAAVEEAGVKLTVSLPRLNAGYTLAAQDILSQGLLGDITLVRTRLSHNGAIPSERGPQGWLPAHFFDAQLCGGGAMIDLGCHPMYLARLFLGLPDSVTASYGYVTGKDVEDNAVSVLRYASGALAVVEAGFVNRFSPFVVEVHGTEGSLLYSTHDDKLLVRSSKLGEDGSQEWKVQELPSDRPSAFDQWVSHVENGTKAEENIQLALDLTRLMEASNASARTGAAFKLSDLAQ
ncbi:Gfo/Idh/MocA family oxidoreductase [Paenibacillus doosanensis]|uniref:1,5-anhydro-D-fructose reductase n=1 Tax=Paenibacillus konkukensis TaxID=2020716 RepID=A0ABY4RUD3_9BACL|nr:MULTISPECIES: Gfo/Idh/MocA family oxidoreductase [Paenibacillus]MCS7460821.1 Gfo/Idh/MocA family oxidoreductase [Paenibacillus doosanensis]UQZ86001.1 1,5-anhydro-D-fructose reductase [Paenibacillus konkukensis]